MVDHRGRIGDPWPRYAGVPARTAHLRPLADARVALSAGEQLSTLAVQLIPPLIRDPAAASREKAVGAHLPYAAHIDDHTLLTRNGMLCQVLHLRGFLFEAADSDEISYRKRLRDRILQAIGSSRHALYFHVLRREIDAGLEARFPTISQLGSNPPGARG